MNESKIPMKNQDDTGGTNVQKQRIFCRAWLMAFGAYALLCFFAQHSEASVFSLGPGDILEISVWKDEELSRKVLVRPDGLISFPLVGDIQAEGRTVAELRQEIETKIKEYVPDTTVSVMVLEANSPRMYIVGKVNKPGAYLMMGETTIIQALAWAGGPATFASTGDIRVIRKKGDKQEVSIFDYDDLASAKAGNLDVSLNFVLHPGDTIIVP